MSSTICGAPRFLDALPPSYQARRPRWGQASTAKAAPKTKQAGVPPGRHHPHRRKPSGPQLLPLRVKRRLLQDPPLVRLPQHHHLDLVAGRCRAALDIADREAHPHGIAIGARRHTPDPLPSMKIGTPPGNLRPDEPKAGHAPTRKLDHSGGADRPNGGIPIGSNRYLTPFVSQKALSVWSAERLEAYSILGKPRSPSSRPRR